MQWFANGGLYVSQNVSSRNQWVLQTEPMMADFPDVVAGNFKINRLCVLDVIANATLAEQLLPLRRSPHQKSLVATAGSSSCVT